MSESSEKPQIVVEQPQPKDKLSDEQMGALLSAFGNHEAKAMVLILMQPGNVYQYGLLHFLFMESQGKNPGWRINSAGPFGYCKDSLAPIGLVTKEIVDESLRTFGYMITDYGEQVGKPLAGLLMDFSRRHPDISLSDLFGGTASKYAAMTGQNEEKEVEYKKRSPLTRYKIFYELSTANNFPIQVSRLAESIDEDAAIIGNHLAKIGERGIVSYESISPHNPISVYSLAENHPEEKPQSYLDKGKLTRWVYQILQENPRKKFRIHELETLYAAQNDGNIGQGILIKNILAYLKRKGYANSEKFTALKYSEINLSEEQRQVLVELVQILDAFQNQDPEYLKKGADLANFFKSHQEETSGLMGKAKEHSSAANKRPRDETAEYILSIIGENPGITISDVRKILKETYQIPSQRTDIWEIADSLVKSGQLSSFFKNGRNRYNLTKSETSY